MIEFLTMLMTMLIGLFSFVFAAEPPMMDDLRAVQKTTYRYGANGECLEYQSDMVGYKAIKVATKKCVDFFASK